jgi:hypothetical protein
MNLSESVSQFIKVLLTQYISVAFLLYLLDLENVALCEKPLSEGGEEATSKLSYVSHCHNQ